MIEVTIIMSPINDDTMYYNDLGTKWMQAKASIAVAEAKGKDEVIIDVHREKRDHLADCMNAFQIANAEYFV